GTTQNTFADVEFRLAETVGHVLEQCFAGITDDREDGFESGVQTNVESLFRRQICLGELFVRINLDSQKIRNIHSSLELAKVLTDTFFLGVCISHQRFLLTSVFLTHYSRI